MFLIHVLTTFLSSGLISAKVMRVTLAQLALLGHACPVMVHLFYAFLLLDVGSSITLFILVLQQSHPESLAIISKSQPPPLSYCRSSM